MRKKILASLLTLATRQSNLKTLIY